MIQFNLTISNVPGSQMPLYLDWGIVVDRDIVDDDGLVTAQATLLELATSTRAATPTRSQRTESRPATPRDQATPRGGLVTSRRACSRYASEVLVDAGTAWAASYGALGFRRRPAASPLPMRAR
jgi:hypothetical protein